MTRMPSDACAPIALFCYRRPVHTLKVLEALSACREAAGTDLIVFVDGPRDPSEVPAIREVASVARAAGGFKSVNVRESPTNRGLARSVTSGVRSVLAERGRVIVVEDDLVVSPYFLDYMNAGLRTYADDSQVASIHGYVYPVRQPLPETFFLRGADCWGWATWARAWEHYEPDGERLLRALRETGQESTFDFNGTAGFMDMLRAQIRGENDSWAVRWYASAFLAGMLTLYPGRSLVHNIGLDGSGEHRGTSRRFTTGLSPTPISAERIPLVESPEARAAFTHYFSRLGQPSLPRRGLSALRRVSRLGRGQAR